MTGQPHMIYINFFSYSADKCYVGIGHLNVRDRTAVTDGGQAASGIPKFIRVFCLLCSLMVIAGCGESVRTNLPERQMIVAAQASLDESSDYIIQEGDKLDIKFLYNPELNSTVTVTPHGKISLFLIPDVVAKGLTPEDFTDKLTKLYADFITHPEINVAITATPNQKIWVDGEVRKQGAVLIAGRNIDVLQALAEAGGISDTGRKSDVIVIRRVTEKNFNIYSLDIEKAIDGTDIRQNIRLMPMDIVYVPKTPIAKLDMWVDQYLKKVLFFNVSLGTAFQTISP
ncbi:MAG: polysaccharide biosynthesis/export family protein [Nitrospirae bacterium]|nr:polysaccharide biosynthesis/export family protein [Nitrospirota bacterium]